MRALSMCTNRVQQLPVRTQAHRKRVASLQHLISPMSQLADAASGCRFRFALARLRGGTECIYAKKHSFMVCAAKSEEMAASEILFSLPQTAVEAINQAAQAVERGFEVGFTRQQIELLLPIEQRRQNYMFTETMEYPENASLIYQTAGEMAKALIKALGYAGEVLSTRIDDDGIDGEPVGVYSTANSEVVVITQPTADVLPKIRDIEKEQGRKVILLNPMWRTKGNIVSDFGFGPWRKKAEDFVSKFAVTYKLTEQRIGAASTLDPATGDYMGIGGVARLLQVYPGNWQVFSIGKDGSSECIVVQKDEPTYQQLEETFRRSKTSLKTTRKGESSEEDRMKMGLQSTMEMDFSLMSGAEIRTAVQAGLINPSDAGNMDKSALRAALGAWGLPTSGKVEELRKRLMDKMALVRPE